MLSKWSCKIFLTSKFSYLLFPNPTHKTKTGTANRWGTANRSETNTNPLWHCYKRPIRTGSSSQIILLHSSLFCFAVPSTTLSKLCKNAGLKPLWRAKPAWFDFSSSSFNLQDGAALRSCEAPAMEHQSTNIGNRNFGIFHPQNLKRYPIPGPDWYVQKLIPDQHW